MNSKDYWAWRSALDMVDRMGTAEQTAVLMSKAEKASAAVLNKEIKAVFRGMQSFGISEQEARQILNAAHDKSALRRLKSAAGRVADPQHRTALLNAIDSAGAYRWRIGRLDTLDKEIDSLCTSLYKTQNRAVTSALQNIARDSYYHSIFNLQQQTGLAFSFAQISQKTIDRILHYNWSGQSYSQRIWKNTNALAAQLKNELLVSMLSGRSGNKTARVISERFGANMYCARRLVRTESAYVSNAAVREGYSEAGISRYRFVAILDNSTSEVCADLDGQVFDLDKAAAGTNYPPMHPFCRSTTIAEFGDEEIRSLERRAKDENGNTVRGPADMSYQEWYDRYVEQKTLDKSVECGIMKVGSDDVALELQRYGRNKTTLVNKTYIDSGEYRRKFDHATENTAVNKTLYDCAKQALKHRSGTELEDMYWIDSKTGTIVAKEINNTVKRQVDYSSATKKIVNSYETGCLIAIHSHPSSMPPSVADFNACFQHGYKFGFVACHDGRIYAYSSQQTISEQLYDLYLNEFIESTHDEFQAQILTLNKLKENHNIDFWEV